MKTFENSTWNLVLGIAMLALSPIAACAQEASVPLDLASASANVDEQVAKDVSAELRAARERPHPARTRRSPTVEISDVLEDAAPEMYVVVVEASRLPPIEAVTAQTLHTVSVPF